MPHDPGSEPQWDNRMPRDENHWWDQLADLGRRALTGTDQALLIDDGLALVRTAVPVDCCNLLELAPDGRLAWRAWVGWSMLPGRAAIIDADRAIPAAEVFRSRAPVVVDDLATDGRFPEAVELGRQGVVSSIHVPLHGRDHPVGVLGAHTITRRKFTVADVAFVQAVANVLAAAAECERLGQTRHERHLLRAEQLMAIGQVAAGVAHELRNPLTSIKGLVQVNLREAQANGVPADDLAVIEHEVRRMERTLQTFLDFARPPTPNRQPLNLVDVVERVLAVVAGRAKKQQVVIHVTPSPDAAQVHADRDQLQQLLLNLVLNSFDAMPGGGRIEIDLGPARDGFVEMTVRDTGPGIAPHILPKVFETFVSGKETGVGLGLPLSKRIAEDHGGDLTVYNLPGGGACFVLRLPAV